MIANGHATKLFDGSRIADDKIELLLRFLRSIPSSVNVQALHYVIAASPAARDRIARAMPGPLGLNVRKVTTASHVIVLCTRMSLPSSHLERVAAQEHADGKFQQPEQEQHWRAVVQGWLALHEYDCKDLNHWMEKQTYLALGMAMMAAAELGIDVSPMEGFDPRILDAELGLRERGFTSSLLLALGRRSPDDYNAGTPKSRLPAEELFTVLD